jgi:hypothetical protein
MPDEFVLSGPSSCPYSPATWKGYSPKFAGTEFYEVRQDSLAIHRLKFEYQMAAKGNG